MATGSYYCWLAQNLVMSYRLFSNADYPMYVMTDKKSEKQLKKYFDGVIVMEEPTYTFFDKIAVYEHSPFDETIFLDADMNIIRDISFLFDMFEKNGSAVSCLGSRREITADSRPIHFGEAAVKAFSLTHYLAFGGGIYYFRRGPQADALIRMVFDELAPNYQAYQMKVFRAGQMADEPLMGLAMLLSGMDPVDDTVVDIMRYSDHMMDTVKWDFKKQECTFFWQDKRIVRPEIIHYGTHNTRHKKYVFFNSVIRCKYFRIMPLMPFYLIYRESRLMLLHLSRDVDRRAFRKWFTSHFTRQHLQYRKNQIRSLFKKSSKDK